jgi:hypothetical protein
MTVIIDPEVRIIGDTSQIFVLHPGENKKFQQDFAAFSAVFLDLPGISFNAPPNGRTEESQRLLRMARAIRSWRNSGSHDETQPSRDPATYNARGQIESARFLNEVDDLYVDAKAGDLVIVPGKGYGRTLLIGEFVNDFDTDYTVLPGRYQGERVPARRVRWLRLEGSKTDFSARLIRLLQNRQAIIRVTEPELRHEIYEYTYGDYVWGETSGNLIRVTAQDVDLNDLSKAVDLTNFFAAQYLALKKGELEKFLLLDFADAIDVYYDKAYFGGVAVDIHSPGFFGRTLKSAAMAGYISVMLALSATNISAEDASHAIVANSANSAVSICDVELEADIRQTMVVYANLNLWESTVCPKRQKAQATVGLTSDVKVENIETPSPRASAAENFAEQSGH